LRPRGTRLTCEQLEDRTVPSNFTAATVHDLIHDIKAANRAGGSNTIALVAGNTFTLTAVDNTTDGDNGLPVIAANDNLTIQGNGDTIERSTASGTPYFRLLDVAPGASLTVANATFQGGYAYGSGARGGAIFNQGDLTLTGVTVTHNSVAGGGTLRSGGGRTAYGGGLYVASGTATMDNFTFSFNTAWGGVSNPAYGGAVYVAGGTVTLTSVTLWSNSARGGQGADATPSYPPPPFGYWGGPGGNAYGGGLYVAAGTVTLTSVTLSSNSAVGGPGGRGSNPGLPGHSFGGALYVGGGIVTLRSDTITGNSASSPPRLRYGLGERRRSVQLRSSYRSLPRRHHVG
jgi:hypothetical protein